MVDPACAAPEGGAECGEQPKERLKKLALEEGSESQKGRERRENRQTERQSQTRQRSENTLLIVPHLPERWQATATATATATAAAAATAATAGGDAFVSNCVSSLIF